MSERKFVTQVLDAAQAATHSHLRGDERLAYLENVLDMLVKLCKHELEHEKHEHDIVDDLAKADEYMDVKELVKGMEN